MQLELTTDPDTLTSFLRQQKWIKPDDQVLVVEKPGEGNMNVVVRAITKQTRLILKQSRPYVQKYPQVPAPEERTLVEGFFYETVQDTGAGTLMPSFVGLDKQHLILAVEDLGEGADYTCIYKKTRNVSREELDQLTGFLNLLHHETAPPDNFPDNLPLRKLNHEHLFVFPFMRDNGFNLDSIEPGLQEISETYKTDQQLRQRLNHLGVIYLSKGSTLLHGDYYPGSWLRTANGIRIIDPEFCYIGHTSFDVGIYLAHLLMAGSSDEDCSYVLRNYHKARDYDDALRMRFTGMEILRRIIGLAQLPLDRTLQEKDVLLKQAAQWVLA
jgi:5-methylthioribose kinase